MEDTIVALATPNGSGAIAVIRLSGGKTIGICDEVFGTKSFKSKNLRQKAPNTIHFGIIHNNGVVIDEVLLSLFKGSQSYTGEDVIEISCHGSVFIQQQIIKLLTSKGARMANPGEFTLRAFLNKKLDLSQAEAVADLIASNSEASHRLAMQQMRGGFSTEIEGLREQLINFASLIELELDFAEEDVEFADRTQLKQLINKITAVTTRLIHSFDSGNALKNGISVAIVGKPNAGKSTLLNALLNEERAIVSEIAGTTRDTIEEAIQINGVIFRFIDTAGLRTTTDIVENIGVQKAMSTLQQARIVIYLFDVTEMTEAEVQSNIAALNIDENKQHIIVVGNKTDKLQQQSIKHQFANINNLILIAAKEGLNLHELTEKLSAMINTGILTGEEVIVSNARHADALQKTTEILFEVQHELDSQISGELLAQNIRQALYYLGLITGKVSSEDLLINIFSKFCIGK
jgi:tRNA modification GTPase